MGRRTVSERWAAPTGRLLLGALASALVVLASGCSGDEPDDGDLPPAYSSVNPRSLDGELAGSGGPQGAGGGTLDLIDDGIAQQYQEAGLRHRVPWTLLAALGSLATGHGAESPYDDVERDPGGTADPPIGSLDDNEAVGPLLLTPAAASQARNPQNLPDALDVVGAALADAADEQRREIDYNPYWPDAYDEAEDFWGSALTALDVTVADPRDTGDLGTCPTPTIAPDNPERVAVWINSLFRCELSIADSRDGILEAVDYDPDSDSYQTFEGTAAIDRLTRDAREIAYVYSGWDDDACPTLPLPESFDGDECDPRETIPAAAQAVAEAATVPLEDRGDAWAALRHTWQALDGVGGSSDTLAQFDEFGPASAARAGDACADALQVQAVSLSLNDADIDEALDQAALLWGGDMATDERCEDAAATEDRWHMTVADEIDEVANYYFQNLEERVDPLDPDEAEEVDDELDREHENVDDARPDDLAAFEERIGRLQEAAGYLREQAGATTDPEPGRDALLHRLSPQPQQPPTMPQWRGAQAAGSRPDWASAVIREANTLGGLTPLDDREHGAGGFDGVNCDAVRRDVDPDDTRALAELIYETFYCNLAAAGYDSEPPTQNSRFDGDAIGFSNYAQQVASEAVAVGWCESAGFSAAQSTNAWGYTGVFQMGSGETERYIPGADATDVAANILGAARYFLDREGVSHPFQGWTPWAVVNTDFATAVDSNGNMPNFGVRRPILPRFASTHPQHPREGGAELPAWAINPYQDAFPSDMSETGGCPYTPGSSWQEIDGLSYQPPGEVPDRAQPRSSGGRYCPVDGDPSFIDDWHFPRGGGSRLHMGNDVFAPRGTPIRAIDDATIEYAAYVGLGGLSVAYTTDSGEYWYLTHNDWNRPDLEAGTRVEAGEEIARVGNTGNARTTPPHAHIEHRPSGRGTTRVNPYPTLVELCR